MNIDLSDYLTEKIDSLHYESTFKIDTMDIGGRSITFTKPIFITVDINKVDGSGYLYGNIAYEYIENCARCLKEFNNKVIGVLNGRIVERSSKNEEDIEEDVIYYEGEDLDLTKYVKNTIILSMPMKSLCNENCKGLCPKCGKNLNGGKCDCVIEDIDPRLAKLKDLIID